MATPGEAKIVPNFKTVKITHIPGYEPKCDPPNVHIRKHLHEEVVWECAENFTVTMKTTTPFDGGNFDQGHNHSGEARPEVPPSSTAYYYSVQVGSDIADPGVIVDA